MNIRNIAEEIIQAVRDVVQTSKDLHLHEPTLDETDALAVAECVRSGWVSSVGENVGKFENELSKFTGSPYVVAASSGTSALQVALRLVGVGADDEVLVPAISFVATANAVSYLGAIPHFVDLNEKDFGICPTTLRKYLSSIGQTSERGLINSKTNRVIRACVPMHCFGLPSEIVQLKNICDEYGIALVEDAAEGLGSYFDKKHVGRFGKVGVLSFNGNKIITTGGGGALMFEDESLAKKAKHLTTTAKKPHAWAFEHDEMAYNYRLPNLNASLGLSQIKKLPELLRRKKSLANKYSLRFEAAEHIVFAKARANSNSNYWLNSIVVDFSSLGERDEVLGLLHRAKIFARPVWKCLADLPMYSEAPRAELKIAAELEKKIINLPSSPTLENFL
jgi:perosamine synthetase